MGEEFLLEFFVGLSVIVFGMTDLIVEVEAFATIENDFVW